MRNRSCPSARFLLSNGRLTVLGAVLGFRWGGWTMRSSRFLVLSAALSLAAALSFVPAQAASAASTGVSIVQPAENAVLSGTVWLDAVPNGSGDTGVQFYLSNGLFGNAVLGCPPQGCLLGNATLTRVGWVLPFKTLDWSVVPVGWSLTAVVQPSGATSSPIDVSLNNPPPTFALPANNATLSGTQWLDCVPPPGENPYSVDFYLDDSSNTQHVGTAAGTLFGWVYQWSTPTASNGPYTLRCTVRYQPGGAPISGTISITVSN